MKLRGEVIGIIEMSELSTIKYTDLTAKLAISLIPDYESFEEDGYGMMYDAVERVKCKTIYNPDEHGQIHRDCEIAYDIWFMSSRDMTEFYKTLNRLYQEKESASGSITDTKEKCIIWQGNISCIQMRHATEVRRFISEQRQTTSTQAQSVYTLI